MKKFALGLVLVALLSLGTTNTQAGIMHGGKTDGDATTNGIMHGGKSDVNLNDFMSYLAALLDGIMHGG